MAVFTDMSSLYEDTLKTYMVIKGQEVGLGCIWHLAEGYLGSAR